MGTGSPEDLKYAALLESALDKDGHYLGTVYRGLHDLTDEQIKSITSAKQISWNALSSASKDETVCHRFLMSEVPIGQPDKGKSVLFKIQSKTGVDLEPVSSGGGFAKEKEVVLKRNTTYEVAGTQKKTITQKIEGYPSWEQEIIEVTLNEK
jgi:hypothetical protein